MDIIFVVILVVAIYAFLLHKGKDKYGIISHKENFCEEKDKRNNITHKENFCEGLTYEEYVEKYGEPEDWMVPWKRD